MITAEDLAEQALYAANAPDCCSKEERAKNMLGMLGANVSDDEIYHDEYEHYIRNVIDSVNEEFEGFKSELINNHTLEEVFYSAYEIYLKTELAETIKAEVYLDGKIYEALNKECGAILENLYMDFNGEQYASFNTNEDTAAFIKDYCRRCYPEIMSSDTESGNALKFNM